MNAPISIRDWSEELVQSICRFADHWNAKVEEGNEDYPRLLTRGEWDEQFQSFALKEGQSCTALAKACERTIKYLREIGEFTREESTFPSPDYADTMADDLEYALARHAKEGQKV